MHCKPCSFLSLFLNSATADFELRTNVNLKKQLTQMQAFLQDVGAIATALKFHSSDDRPSQAKLCSCAIRSFLRLQKEPIVNGRTQVYNVAFPLPPVFLCFLFTIPPPHVSL